MNTVKTPVGELGVGDFVKVNYKYSAKCGIVTRVSKSRIEYNVYNQYYDTYTKTSLTETVAIRKIHQIGRPANATFIES